MLDFCHHPIIDWTDETNVPTSHQHYQQNWPILGKCIQYHYSIVHNLIRL